MPGPTRTLLPNGRILARLAVLGATLAILASAVGSVSAASPSKSLGHQSAAKVTRLGTGHIGRRSGGEQETDLDQTQPDPEEAQAELNKQIPNSISAARVPSSHVPRPGALPIVDATGAGFDGLNHFDQRTAGTGDYVNTQFSVEPPDQALCVGNGFVVEAVNSAARVRSATGADLSGVVSLSQFWGLAPEVVRPDGPFGPFISDPRCYYDPDTGRFFAAELELDTDPATGAFGDHSSTLLAVSKTSTRRATGSCTHSTRPMTARMARRTTRTARASVTSRSSARTPTASTSAPTSSRSRDPASTANSSMR